MNQFTVFLNKFIKLLFLQRNGGECDTVTSQCEDNDVCKAEGPGETDKENTRIIGGNIYKAASIGLKSAPQRELTGNVGFVHQFVEMSRQTGNWFNQETNRTESFRGCHSAMGTSFAAGTTDGNLLTCNYIYVSLYCQFHI